MRSLWQEGDAVIWCSTHIEGASEAHTCAGPGLTLCISISLYILSPHDVESPGLVSSHVLPTTCLSTVGITALLCDNNLDCKTKGEMD